MAKYPGAANNAGYPSIQLQQYMLQQRARATVAAAPTVAQQADSVRDIGAEISNGTSVSNLYAMLTASAKLLEGAVWYARLTNYVQEVLKSGTYTADHRRRMMAIINGYALPTN